MDRGWNQGQWWLKSKGIFCVFFDWLPHFCCASCSSMSLCVTSVWYSGEKCWQTQWDIMYHSFRLWKINFYVILDRHGFKLQSHWHTEIWLLGLVLVQITVLSLCSWSGLRVWPLLQRTKILCARVCRSLGARLPCSYPPSLPGWPSSIRAQTTNFCPSSTSVLKRLGTSQASRVSNQISCRLPSVYIYNMMLNFT